MEISTAYINTILRILKRQYPTVKTQLAHKTPFQLLVATILSAQCTDVQVNRVTPVLFDRFPTPDKLAGASLDEIKPIVFSTGFYNNKAKNIKACAQSIMTVHGGIVPTSMTALTGLPGVGRKTANLVRSVAFGMDTIVVDTHVYRVSRRLGLSKGLNPAKVESDLMAIIPQKSWNDLCLQMIYLGREFCDARKPLCRKCPLQEICPSNMKNS
ncbi:Putative endonuclease III [Desulforapulum autotrophicum HRM2]|uniref:Endonuclease III n=1 Tax=Desulforapulum autotrophicum (strain ATCC 43914 / DSM 3382 / VKM B-1955 / HRM2) TaxID=177437 RepID=C0QG99_DESAH|nr:endonuclease III [Desulforapulum autotrophicum]ACN17678.1 Putative endonuclease III [Desulforapulum autotrophicum HRM2]